MAEAETIVSFCNSTQSAGTIIFKWGTANYFTVSRTSGGLAVDLLSGTASPTLLGEIGAATITGLTLTFTLANASTVTVPLLAAE